MRILCVCRSIGADDDDDDDVYRDDDDVMMMSTVCMYVCRMK